MTQVVLPGPAQLPDEIDGRALFDIATRRRDMGGVASLSDIVAQAGFRPELRHLTGLGLRTGNGVIQTEPRLHLLGRL